MIAALLSKLFSGSVLLLLPLFIALVSYAFYAFVSTMIFFTVRKHTTSFFAFVACFMSMLLPLGFSQGEIIGTLLQIGFYMPILSLCCHLLRHNVSSFYKKLFYDVFIILMAATNPVNFAISGLYFLINFFSVLNKKEFILKNTLLILSLLTLFIIVVPRMNGSGGIIGVVYNPHHIFEMITARSVLYPFIFPFYDHLNDFTALFFTTIYVCLIALAYIQSDSGYKKIILFVTSALIVYIIATVAGRSALTGLLTGYGSTFPDRYYMGINIISVLLVVLSLSTIRIKFIKYFFVIVFIAIYFVGFKKIITIGADRHIIKVDYVFTNALCNAKNHGEYFKKIAILPTSDWDITVPKQYIDSIECIRN